MYEDFYKLSGTPFSLTPDANCFYMSTQHARALATLNYALISNAAVTVITGEVGTGKTTLVRRVLSNLDKKLNAGLLNNTHPNMGKLLPWILAAFKVDPGELNEIQQYHAFVKYLTNECEAGRRTVLVVDEAQNLTVEALEEVRLLSNLNLGEESILQVVLVGQPELNELLSHEQLRQFGQRIAVDYAISEFDFSQADEYITYRLDKVGGSPSIFDFVARAVVYYHSLGIPRIINNICHLSMAYGYADSKSTIGVDIVRQVIASKKVGMAYTNTRLRSEDAVKLHRHILQTHEVDISFVEPDPGAKEQDSLPDWMRGPSSNSRSRA